MAEPVEFVDDLVHEPSQVDERGVDLTVAGVARIVEAGAADFGGGEYNRPATEPVEPTHRDPDDDYGWWSLDAGTYLLSYNESLSDDAGVLRLQPHPRLLALGVTHPTVRVDTLEVVPLAVPDAGASLKENARVSQLSTT